MTMVSSVDKNMLYAPFRGHTNKLTITSDLSTYTTLRWYRSGHVYPLLFWPETWLRH